MAPRERDWLPKAENDHQHHDRDVEPDPVSLGDRVGDEVGAHRELVHKGQRDRQVGVEVDAVPGLVREALTRGLDRQEAHDHHQPERDGRREHPRVGEEQGVDLVGNRDAGLRRKADRGEDPMADEQPQRAEADPLVPTREIAGAEQLVQPRAARHEDYPDEREVGTEQRRDLAQRREQAAKRSDLRNAAVNEPHSGDDECVGGDHRPDLDRMDRPDLRKRWDAGTHGEALLHVPRR